MSKEQAFQIAEKLLMHIYDGQFDIIARICTASADKDADYLWSTLDEVIKFINKIKEGLKP